MKLSAVALLCMGLLLVGCDGIEEPDRPLESNQPNQSADEVQLAPDITEPNNRDNEQTKQDEERQPAEDRPLDVNYEEADRTAEDVIEDEGEDALDEASDGVDDADTRQEDVNKADSYKFEVPEPGEFGSQCAENDDCHSGLCVPSEIGYICTNVCVADCPTNWSCKAANIGGQDVMFVCLPSNEMACEYNNQCEAGSNEEESCGNCGKRTRSCSESCRWSAWSACSGEGECLPGITQDGVCGFCGHRSRTCSDTCRWNAWEECQDQGECDAGSVVTEDCGLCGERSKHCTAQCKWSDWTACSGQGQCVLGSAEDRACGNCGRETRTCSDTCNWTEWSACEDQGVCTPGEVQVEPCGKCGERMRTCTFACGWGDWTPCTGQGECVPGAWKLDSCLNCGLAQVTCQSDCTWGERGSCLGTGTCWPGAVEELACGKCGVQTRTCTDACGWGAWGSCTSQGVCTPGQVETRECGNCGVATRTCTSRCQWGAWSACKSEGECGPGDVEACGNCGRRTCTSQCTWGACNIGTVDQYEENDTKVTARVLPKITDHDGDATGLYANINPTKDPDWFRVHITDATGALIDPWVRLSQVPLGQTYRLCVFYECNQASGVPPELKCIHVVGGNQETVKISVAGCDDNCGFNCYDNGGDMFMWVHAPDGGSCSSYRLDYGA
ncbi:MAG TPA: hypothetical protein PK329_02385 [Myxococcota bacterium]|nr:hypothetical protein [Myxococcota bacterium]HOS62828.1 hypothetical protein [Myxococcota bacterium]HPC92692.1 hypothetical protein [Myxococcota bacterium]HPL24645.1 hypothetical protein [Myxococcota bacterium]HQE73214.1 hypothetical protein [Myxococcota bacterium]